jgi:hypothetical protein
VYTHLFGALVLAAHFGWGMLYSGSPRRWRGILIGGAAIAVLISPLIHLILTIKHLSWVPRPTLTSVAQVFADLAGRGGRGLLIAYFLACCAALFRPQRGLSAEAKQVWRRGLLFAMSWLLVPVLGSLLVSLAWKPIFVSRYLMVAVPALVLIAAAGVTSLRPAPVRVVALVALLAAAAGGLVRWYAGRYPKENWRAAAHDVLANARPGDGIAFEPPYVRIPFEYYLERRGPEAATPQPVFPAAAWGALDPIGSDLAERLDEWLRRNRPNQQRLWVVVSHAAPAGLDAVPVWLPAELERSGCRIGDHAYTYIRVLLYEAAPCDRHHPAARGQSSLGLTQ